MSTTFYHGFFYFKTTELFVIAYIYVSCLLLYP